MGAGALSDAAEQLDDFLLAELVELYHETGPAAVPRMFSDRFLPARYVDFYDFKMARRLYACLLVVAAGSKTDGSRPGAGERNWSYERSATTPRPASRTWSASRQRPSSTCETCCSRTSTTSTCSTRPSTASANPETYEGSQLGILPLHPSNWFIAFQEDSPVHPLVA